MDAYAYDAFNGDTWAVPWGASPSARARVCQTLVAASRAERQIDRWAADRSGSGMGANTEGIDLRRSAQCQQEALYEGLMGAGYALAVSAPLVYVARRNYPMLVRSASVQTVRAVPLCLTLQGSRAGTPGDGSAHPARYRAGGALLAQL